MLDSSFRESREGLVHLPDEAASSSVFSAVLDYIYTGSVSIDGESALELLHAAHLFGYPRVVAASAEFVANRLDVDAALHVEQFASLHNDPDCSQLAATAHQYLIGFVSRRQLF